MIKVLNNPFYYLDNFQHVLDWISERYDDLLLAAEWDFIAKFLSLPAASRALLVRMVMRKGVLFRAGKLVYDEIGPTHDAAQPLLRLGWIDDNPLLTIGQISGLMKKSEIARVFGQLLPGGAISKSAQLDILSEHYPQARHLRDWGALENEAVYALGVTELCERFRLLYFGNLHQDWTEFVLSELGVFKYEKVEFSAASRGFRTRGDVDDYLHLYRCRERFLQAEPMAEVVADIPVAAYDNPWLESRRARVLFQIAQQCERLEDWVLAAELYRRSRYPGARLRLIRVLERQGQAQAALALADVAGQTPESEAEHQQLCRIVPRLRRKLGLPRLPPETSVSPDTMHLSLPRVEALSVERLVQAHLHQENAPAFYVENALINSLFGLLCWDAIFASVPGAFFHPYHGGPADLHAPDFYARRQSQFDECFSRLDSGAYRHIILQRFHEKYGTQSPFVYWGALSEELLQQALACLPAAHLEKWCRRILQDIKANRNGFPDLIQFWPAQQRYRMVEVKGPGDRLQDNQLRWLAFCAAHAMPVAVCYVQWAGETEAQANPPAAGACP